MPANHEPISVHPPIGVPGHGRGFNAPALLPAVQLWARTTTDPESPTRLAIERVKTNVVMGCLDFCHKSPALVTPQDIQAYQAELEADGLKPATVYTYLLHVSSFYTWAMRVPGLADAIRNNPVRLVKPRPPKAYASKKTKALTDEQVAALLAAVERRAQAVLPPQPTDIDVMRRLAAKRDLAILLFFLLTGMRRREIIQLRWGDVTLRRDGSLVVRTQIKGGRQRARAIQEPSAQDAVRDYLQASGRWAAMRDDSPLWTRHDRAGAPGKPLTSHAFYQNLQTYSQEAGLGHINPHKTRHTYARWVGEESGSLHAVQEALGHQNIATTKVYLQQIAVEPDHYSSAIAARVRRAMDDARDEQGHGDP